MLGAHGYARTLSEEIYEHIEPWIQWFTVHTGMPYAKHGVFRLGDGPQAGAAADLGGTLPQRGLKVARVLAHERGQRALQRRVLRPGSVDQDARRRAASACAPAYDAICQAVGDNAEGRDYGGLRLSVFRRGWFRIPGYGTGMRI